MSQEDSRAVSIMESTVRLHDGHYDTALPWSNFPPRLPNNRPLAEHRLMLLKKKLLKNPVLLSKYADFMDDLFNKNFARKVPTELLDQSNGLAWYLPLHAICPWSSVRANQTRFESSLTAPLFITGHLLMISYYKDRT